MNYTDDQLKRALCKMLPEQLMLGVNSKSECYLFNTETDHVYLNTELLHICWMIEQTLSEPARLFYMRLLIPDEQLDSNDQLTNGAAWTLASASWQFRTIALAKLKGVEII